MHPKKFLSYLEDRKIIQAIAEAEHKTSGQIRVYISQKHVTDVVSEAKVHFLRLGMEKTRARNAVLLYLAPRSRNFAVVGDVAVHEKCGDTFWQDIALDMEQALRQQKYTEAIVIAVQRVGAALAAHFPRHPDDRNELPDDVIRD